MNNQKINSKGSITNRIIDIIAIIILLIVLIVVNFEKAVLEINEQCEDLEISLEDSTIFKISDDQKATLIYFYETLTIDEANAFEKYADEKLNIILVKTHNGNINNDILENLNNLNIKYATDDKKEQIISKFTKDIEYPYSVFLDTTDKLLIKNKGLITLGEYTSIVIPTMLGKTVGNEVGNVCINKEIGLVGSSDTFSVFENQGKITIINFWYTSCTPCVGELPHFNSLYEEYKDDVTVIAIHEASMYNSNPDQVAKFINNQFGDFTIMFGYDDEEAPYYTMLGGKKAWPTTIIVDQEGVISFVQHGSLTEAELRTQIENLLDEKKVS